MTVLTHRTDRASADRLSGPYPELLHFQDLLQSLRVAIQDLAPSNSATASNDPALELCHCSSPPLQIDVSSQGGIQ